MLLELARRKSVNPRLLKVFVSVLQEKILQNKMKLRDKDHLEHIRSIIVIADLTPLEQKRIKVRGATKGHE